MSQQPQNQPSNPYAFDASGPAPAGAPGSEQQMAAVP